MGLFSPFDRVEQHYLKMEGRFLELAEAINVPAANLDSLIWQNMRNSPRLIAGLFGESLNTHRPFKQRGHHLPKRGQSQQA